ncbi:small conductance mechanosensitive ion channel family [Dorcoceras hygrometricum]|uniref:Small conductance mechanosensitive ion channel family n=1 Tax=Dorcoceras hygrometricum TaxID=472368 RepID=A0A2Z7CAD5_9LAMI|nr:small conductance mechanosensitive ion channel family [Dorcoceras hygrometricum]
MTIHSVFSFITLLATRAWLRPVSRGNRHFTVGGGRLCQSGPRPEARLLCQPALEGLTRSAWTDLLVKFAGTNSGEAAAAQGGDGGGGF